MTAALVLLAACGGDPSALEADLPEDVRASRTQGLEAGLGANHGREFWLTFPGNHSASPPDLTLLISGRTPATGQVRMEGLGFTAHFSVTPGAVTSVALPLEAQLEPPNIPLARGIHVTADADITVHGLSSEFRSSDGYLALPRTGLGTEYVVLSYPFSGTSFALVSTEDNTRVTIVPSATASTRPRGVPFTLRLARGQAYQLRSTLAGAPDLSGSLITSDKPIAVFGGHQCADVPDSSVSGCNFLVEQLPPTRTWGRSFVTLPLSGRRTDTFRIVAATDGTQLSINGAVVATLNRGQVHQRTLQGPATLTATQPILVAQYSHGATSDGAVADPFMALVPPSEQFLTRYTLATPPSGFDRHFLNVVLPDAALGALLLDGVAVPASAFSPIGTSGFSGAQLPIGAGAHELSAPLAFGVAVYGYSPRDGYGYPGGMAQAPVAEVASVTLAPKSASQYANESHCVTATVKDATGQPLAGVRVDFAVAGANTRAGLGHTDAAGLTTWCYRGTHRGTDSLRASVGPLFDTATHTWTEASKVKQCHVPRITRDATVRLCGWTTTGLDGSGIASVWFTIDGGAPLPVTPEPSGGFVDHSVRLADGPHVLRLHALSKAGHLTVRELTVTVDTTPPTLSVHTPNLRQGLLAGNTVEVTSSVRDATAVHVVTQWVRSSLVESGTGTVTHTVNVASQGWSTVLVRATDAAGNVSQARVRVYMGP
jgi:hypothetical protein